MLNQYVPFPRYENAVFIGDTAVSILSAMRIYAKALIGGELPNMERYYPQEKLLECTACFMNDLRVLTCAISHGDIDYILLEDNGKEELNPAHRAEELKALGYEVRVLRVSDPINSLKKLGTYLMSLSVHSVLFAIMKKVWKVWQNVYSQQCLKKPSLF